MDLNFLSSVPKKQSNLDTHFIQIVIHLVFVSFCSLKMREKHTNWDYLVCTSLVSVYIIFEHRAIYVYVYKRKYFLKVNIDGSVLKEYTNWDKLSCLSLYIFLLFGGNEGRQKPNIPHPMLHCYLWQYWLWIFHERDTKLERFLDKNQLLSNEIIKFCKLV